MCVRVPYSFPDPSSPQEVNHVRNGVGTRLSFVIVSAGHGTELRQDGSSNVDAPWAMRWAWLHPGIFFFFQLAEV